MYENKGDGRKWRGAGGEVRNESIFTTEGTENTEGKRREDGKRNFATDG